MSSRVYRGIYFWRSQPKLEEHRLVGRAGYRTLLNKAIALFPLNRASALLSEICQKAKFQSPRTGNQMFPRPPSWGSNPSIPHKQKTAIHPKMNVSSLVGRAGFEPTSLAAMDFKSIVYTVPPPAPIVNIVWLKPFLGNFFISFLGNFARCP